VPVPDPEHQIQVYKLCDITALDEAVAYFQKSGPQLCIHPAKRKMVTSAGSFDSCVRTPLPVDQKLLTLLHFNLVRALTSNILLLGCNPDEMNEDINSPFAPACQLPSANPDGVAIHMLPPTLRPTAVQLSVPHHPEMDLFPFPQYRDNIILAGSTVDDVELCVDMLYGVDINDNSDSGSKMKRRCDEGPFSGSGRTGLIVWDDPWLQESWEVDEGFATKYKWLLRGCDALLRSTNHWRARRGEQKLVLDWS
jgi:hypothetical protein